MPCILHARGTDFRIEHFLRTTSLKVFCAWQRGVVYGPAGETFPDSGFSIEVSPADFVDPAEQIADAEAFLTTHRSELKRLWRQAGIDGVNLDFGFFSRISPTERSFWDAFPHTLLKLCGELKIDLEVSYYPHPDVDYRWYEAPSEKKPSTSKKSPRSKTTKASSGRAKTSLRRPGRTNKSPRKTNASSLRRPGGTKGT
jgi:hypothetical protein